MQKPSEASFYWPLCRVTLTAEVFLVFDYKYAFGLAIMLGQFVTVFSVSGCGAEDQSGLISYK